MSDKHYFIGLCIDVEHKNVYSWKLSNLILILDLCISLCRLCIVFACILLIKQIYVLYKIV